MFALTCETALSKARRLGITQGHFRVNSALRNQSFLIGLLGCGYQYRDANELYDGQATRIFAKLRMKMQRGTGYRHLL